MSEILTSGTLASRFVNAYNLLDHSLRTQYNFKANISFSDLIRRTATLNQVIRRYEDDLIDLARLRNAIIHSKSEQVIAEPHEDVVELLEKVARIISTPPLVIDIGSPKTVDTITADSSLKNYIIMSAELGHSNIPVYKRDMLIGVLQRHTVLEVIGHEIKRGKSVDEYLSNTTIETFLKEYPNSGTHFSIVSSKVTIEETLELFTNRKLSAVIITSDGTSGGKLVGIVTNADVLNLMHILEGY
jgi:predicted transcriptional regulator